jgi:hypothetical protein
VGQPLQLLRRQVAAVARAVVAVAPQQPQVVTLLVTVAVVIKAAPVVARAVVALLLRVHCALVAPVAMCRAKVAVAARLARRLVRPVVPVRPVWAVAVTAVAVVQLLPLMVPRVVSAAPAALEVVAVVAVVLLWVRVHKRVAPVASAALATYAPGRSAALAPTWPKFIVLTTTILLPVMWYPSIPPLRPALKNLVKPMILKPLGPSLPTPDLL